MLRTEYTPYTHLIRWSADVLHLDQVLRGGTQVPRARRDVSHDCVYRVFWSTKYSRPLLVGLENEVKLLLEEAAIAQEAKILDMQVNDQVVSVMIRVNPINGVHRVITGMKSKSASVLRRRYAELKSRSPSLWNSKYFVASLGTGPDEASVLAFLERQRLG